MQSGMPIGRPENSKNIHPGDIYWTSATFQVLCCVPLFQYALFQRITINWGIKRKKWQTSTCGAIREGRIGQQGHLTQPALSEWALAGRVKDTQCSSCTQMSVGESWRHHLLVFSSIRRRSDTSTGRQYGLVVALKPNCAGFKS